MALKAAPLTLRPPYQNKLVDAEGIIDRVWAVFFRELESFLTPLGKERTAELVNNQSGAADIEGLAFDKTRVSQAAVDYLIQRVTTGGGAVELIEAGTFYAAYKPTSNSWALTNVPSTANVTLSITSAGQVQYTTSNEGGTAYISRIVWRARTLQGKHSSYSEAG